MKQRDILLILISGFIIIVFWIAFNIIHNSITSTISENLAIQIVPIAPNFDIKTIEKIKTRQKISPLYDVENQSLPSRIATPSSLNIIVSPSPISSLPATLSPSPTIASNGGAIQ